VSGATGSTSAAVAPLGPTFKSATTTNLAAGSAAGSPRGVPNTNPANRLVAQNASLTLAATPVAMQDVANEVVSSTVRLGGIVKSSNVDVHGFSSYASFSLSVPSAKLPSLIGALSSLAAVRSLEQGTSDITNTYDAAAATLAEEKAQHAGLLKALAAAVTLAEQQVIEAKITAIDATIKASTGRVDRLLSRGHNAQVSVAIVAARAAGATSAGPVGRALNDALSVLDVVLAIALVALAVVLPIGAVALALWWAAASLRQRSRERALQATS
jgi:hypothetical protein